MFKSKGFTIAFTLMSLVIVALTVFFLSLVFGKGKEALLGGMIGIQTTETPDTEPQTVSETALPELRALHLSEEHQYPVLDEEIPETGRLTIIIGGAPDGVIFHKLPKFDGADSEGNEVHTSGTFEVVSKVYIYDQDTAYLMYRTKEGFYVTSNTKYVSFKADTVKVLPDSKKKKVYGTDDQKGFLVRVLQEDGNHLAFSIYQTGETQDPFLTDVIASYDAFGTANFEYKYGSEAYRGLLTFGMNEESGEYRIKLSFDEPIRIGDTLIGELSLN